MIQQRIKRKVDAAGWLFMTPWLRSAFANGSAWRLTSAFRSKTWMPAGRSRRASKALEFFRPDSLGPYHLYPHPWRLDFAPYYLVQGLDNSDGHGGYRSICRFDREGVPYHLHRKGQDVYHPLTIARYVLRMFSLSALTGDQDAHRSGQSA